MQWLGVLLIVAFLSSCSSVSNLPNDEVYYTKKAKNPSEYNWDDFQKNAETYSKGNVKVDNETGMKEGAVSSGDIATTVDANDTNGDYQYIDEHYDGTDYSSRIEHFSDEGTSSGFGYYDGYYGGGGGYGMSNWSLSFGMGFGYGYPYGYSMGYGYGWPSYGYGGSYWAGYNAGYMNGYWNGYYGYPYYSCGYCGYGGYYGGGYYGGGYYGGGYPDYIATPSVVYGPRGGTAGGTTIPHSRGEGPSGRPGDNTGKSGSAGGRGTVVAAPATTVNTAGRTIENGDKTGRIGKPASGSVVTTAPKSEYYRTRPVTENIAQDKLAKPQTRQQTAQQTVPQKRYEKPSVKQRAGLPEPKYQKPKSYQSLPSKKPQSSQEYVRPTNRMTRTTTKNYNPYSRTRPATSPTSTRSNLNTGSSSRSYTPARSSGTRSYSSPTRTSTGTRSYSSPTRSSGGSSFSRSSSSGTRSSGTRSSGSSSRGGGGIKR